MAWKNAWVLSKTTGKSWSYFPELNPIRGLSVMFCVYFQFLPTDSESEDASDKYFMTRESINI